MSVRRILILLVTAAAAAATAGCIDGSQGDSLVRSTSAPLDTATDTFVVPRGARIVARLEDPLSSSDVEKGQPFTATVLDSGTADGDSVVPRGSRIHGVVRDVAPAVSGGGDALLALEFVEIEMPDGTKGDISAALEEIASTAPGPGEPARDAVAGRLVGGPAGSSILMAAGGAQVNLPRGTLLTIHVLDRTVVR